MNAQYRYALYTCRNLLILNKLDLLHENLIYILLCKYFTYIEEANKLRSNTSCRLQVPLGTIPGTVAETKRAECDPSAVTYHSLFSQKLTNTKKSYIGL